MPDSFDASDPNRTTLVQNARTRRQLATNILIGAAFYVSVAPPKNEARHIL
jgi:hypothetical protein